MTKGMCNSLIKTKTGIEERGKKSGRESAECLECLISLKGGFNK